MRSSHNSLATILLSLFFIIITYYMSVLLHEWTHGLMAWLYHVKASPFDIQYGGFLLLHADESVPYGMLLAHHKQYEAAVIGISGMIYNVIVLLIAFFFLNKPAINDYPKWQLFLYWTAIMNLCPIMGYIPNSIFSSEGDVGRFIEGTHMSPWLVLIVGTVIVAYWIYLCLGKYRVSLIKNLHIDCAWAQRIILWLSIFILFLLIYSHGYNPFTTTGATLLSTSIAVSSLIVAVILLVILDPCFSKDNS